MIDDLDRSLEELFKRELPPALADQVAITFAAPDDQFPPTSVTLPAIDLFLYDVRENRERRTNEWVMDRGAVSVTKTRPPVRVDCSYLITSWASESAPNPAQDEHRLLGEVMSVLLRHRTLPAEVLQGSLRGQEPALPVASLQSSLLQSVGEFWQALGGKPKASLNYTVTISVQPYEGVEVPVVLETDTGISPIEQGVGAP